MGTIVGWNTDPNNGADNYGVGFTAGLRVVIPSTGSTNKTITKIGGWVATNSNPPVNEAFRFGISRANNSNNQNEETDVASRLYLSTSNILLSSVATSSGNWQFQETISASTTAGAVLFLQQICYVAGDIRFMYLDGQTGQRIYDGYYGGRSLPPADPQNPSELNYYDNFIYGIWIEVEDVEESTAYSAKSVAAMYVAGSAKIAALIKQKSLAQLAQSGSAKTKFSFVQKSPGGILLTGSAKTINSYRAKNLGQAIVGGAAKLRLVSRNASAGFVSFSGAAKLRLISNYIGVGSSVVGGAAKTSLQINTVTLSVVGRGAINLSGAATVKNSLLQKSAGHFQTSGFGAFRFALNHRSQGNVVVNGQLITRLIYSGKSSGSYGLSGAAKIRQISSYVGLAGGVLGGLGKASLVVGSSSVSFVSTGTMVLSGRTLITLLPQVNWYQNPFLTVYYRPRSRVVKAVPLDRSVIAEAKNRTVKFRF